jgi:hypothetical protein
MVARQHLNVKESSQFSEFFSFPELMLSGKYSLKRN